MSKNSSSTDSEPRMVGAWTLLGEKRSNSLVEEVAGAGQWEKGRSEERSPVRRSSSRRQGSCNVSSGSKPGHGGF